MAALLYALVDITDKRKDGTGASTSKPCKWNRPRKRKLSPQKSQNITLKKIKYEEKTTEREPKHKQQLNTCTMDRVKPLNLHSLCLKLKSCAPNAALLLSMETGKEIVQQAEDFKLPNLHTVPYMYRDSVSIENPVCKEAFRNHMSSLHITSEDCVRIEKMTKGQSKNDTWMEARIGRITSSMFGTVCKKRVDTKPDSIIKNIMNYSSFDTEATRWGRNHEAAARRVYQNIIQTSHPGLKVFGSGLVINVDHPHLGTSPDGVVDCCEKCQDRCGVLEIKCPYKHRNASVYEACQDKSFCCSVLKGKISLKKTHSFYYQIQGQMALTGRHWCDFFVWTLKGHYVERIPFDASFWKEMSSKLNLFYEHYVVPEFFTERIKRGKELV